MLVRHCDGPGCHEEQDVGPGDKAPFQADRPWLTVVWESVVPDPLHFCGRECANRYTAPPIADVTHDGKVIEGEDPRDFKKTVKHPAEPWDPRRDSPFGGAGTPPPDDLTPV